MTTPEQGKPEVNEQATEASLADRIALGNQALKLPIDRTEGDTYDREYEDIAAEGEETEEV